MKTIKLTILSLVLLASCSKESDDITPSSSNSATAKLQAARPRPFEAILSAAVDVNSTNPPTACSGDAPFAAPDFVLTGDVSHMGATNGTLHHDACNLSLASIPFLLTTNVSGQIVAANGDYITYTGNDVVDVTSYALQQPNPTGSITGTWTITGGTGRFAGATGSFDISGTVDFVTNTFTCQCLGTITY
jgi:hypothetical protein